ncbi:MAG TPA: DUF1801 domain-containing protein [Labilithrix sp.]|jgi:hypothetical protein|nr:DUF1801 domain-containing protein [Labilithrix sp.]
MPAPKTKPTGVSVDDFIAAIDDERKRDDSRELIAMMQRITGEKPYMWGPSIVGFGNYHYRYESGHEGDAPVAAFSPRKPNLVVYITSDAPEHEELLSRLGKHKNSKGCLYIKRLSDIDMQVLEEMVKQSMDYVRNKYPN